MQKPINSHQPFLPPQDLLRPESKSDPHGSPPRTSSATQGAQSPGTTRPGVSPGTAPHSPGSSGSLGWNQNPFKTPSPVKALPRGIKTFLEQDMNRPDLAPLMLFLVKEFGGNWAISGSVALHMHAIRQDAVNEMTRAPADVDIVMQDQNVDILQEKLKKNNHDHRIHRPPFSSNPTTFHFGDGLKVDVLRAGGGIYGNLSGTVRIGGLPVLSLDQLVASKKAALGVARDEGMEVASQYEADLRVLEILQQKERDSREASASSAAGGTVSRSGAPFESRAKRTLALGPSSNLAPQPESPRLP